MKTLILYILAVVLCVGCVHAQTNQGTASAAAITDETGAAVQTSGVTLTPEQTASLNSGIDSILTFIPAKYKAAIVSLILLLSAFKHLGDFIKAFKAGGIFNAVKSIFNHHATQMLLLVAVAAFCFTGCSSTDGVHHMIVQNESGTALKAKIPVGYAGNNIFELDLTVGTIKTTTAEIPVGTNRFYTPDIAIGANTRGKFTGTASTAFSSTNSNPNALVTGGDSYLFGAGHTAMSNTNDMDMNLQTWQDAPTVNQ